jgi:hypothetical protein
MSYINLLNNKKIILNQLNINNNFKIRKFNQIKDGSDFIFLF